MLNFMNNSVFIVILFYGNFIVIMFRWIFIEGDGVSVRDLWEMLCDVIEMLYLEGWGKKDWKMIVVVVIVVIFVTQVIILHLSLYLYIIYTSHKYIPIWVYNFYP